MYRQCNKDDGSNYKNQNGGILHDDWNRARTIIGLLKNWTDIPEP
jgi:hypothetical protein